MTDDGNWPQFKIRLRPELIEQIKEAAWARKQTATQWCTELFEAALEPANIFQPSLEQRVASLEAAVNALETAAFNRSDHHVREYMNPASSHPWKEPLCEWLAEWGSTPFTSAEALVRAGLRQSDEIQHRDEMALAAVLGSMGWVQRRLRHEGERKRMWFPDGHAPTPVPNERLVAQLITPI